MGTFLITGVAPGLPVDDMIAHPHGGDPDEARARVAELFAGQRLELRRSGAFGEVHTTGGDELLVATYGPTTVLFGVTPASVTTPSGYGVFNHGYQSTVDSYGFEVHTPSYERKVELCEGDIVRSEGTPLPFEEKYWSGQEDVVDDQDLPFRFEAYEWAEAGMQWMFGYNPDGSSPEDRVDLDAGQAHVFEFVDSQPGDALARKLGLM